MILESAEHGLLYAALSKAQAEFPTIRANRKAYKNEYADLYAILKPIYPILSKHELCVMPATGFIDGKEVVGARLGHASGQFITNVIYFKPDEVKNPNDQASHKQAGSLTYMHRNFIKNILGVLISDDEEDDDMQPAQEYKYTAPVQETISKDQEMMLRSLIGDDQFMYEKLIKYYGISSLKDLPRKDFEAAEKNARHILENKKRSASA